MWPSVDIGTHGIPMGPFLRVPRELDSWNEVWKVISQLEPLDASQGETCREYHFGFLLGMIVGDTAKSKPAVGHRHLELTLIQKYGTNLRLGEFTSSCARSLGLRMHRIKDIPPPRLKPHGFFTWVSQASPLIDWIYDVGLGLRDDEVTTYDSLRAEWVFDSPREFRVGLSGLGGVRWFTQCGEPIGGILDRAELGLDDSIACDTWPTCFQKQTGRCVGKEPGHQGFRGSSLL